MTDETDKKKTVPPAGEKKEPLLNTTQLIAGAIAAVTASVVLGSLLGDKGTIIGVALGSIISGSAAALYESALKKAKEATKNRHRILEHGHAVEIITSSAKKAAKPKPVLMGLIFGLLCLVISFGGVSAVEAAAGRTFHGILTDTDNKGFTLGTNYYPKPAPTVTRIQFVTPSPSISVVTVAPSIRSESPSSAASSSASPSLSPSPSSSPSSSPAATGSAPDPTVQSSPSPTASETAS